MADVRQPLATRAALEEESGLRASGDSTLADQIALEAAARAAADDLRALLTDPRFTDARPPTGGAGGVLSGGYPDPGFAVDMAEQSELQTEITNRTADVDAEETARIAAVSAEAAARAATDALLIPLAQKGAANGVPTLDAGSKVPISQLPATAINDTFVVASQAAMLALVAERGDVAIRTDLTKTFILSTDSPGTLADWKEILFPTDAVSSVDGRVGTVTLSDLYDTSGAAAAAQAASQPVDADLTAIAALAGQTAYGRSFLALADAVAARALAGAADDAAVVKLAGAQTITGKKTLQDAGATTVLCASRVTGDTEDRFGSQVDGTMLFGSGAAVPTRGLAVRQGGFTALGDSAGLINTALDIVAVGRSALAANTTGANNNAVGTSALAANTTGANNNAIGRNALLINTTGASNNAVGTSALAANTTGANNMAIGTNALAANTAGNGNVGVGTSALIATTASDNTAIGTNALAGNTTGTNTAIGKNALYAPAGVVGNATTTATRQTAVGLNSGQASATQRNDITVVGYQALADGNNAIAIGSGASAGAAGAVAIGKDSANTSASTTTQDEFVCGTALHSVVTPGWFKWRATREQTTVGAAGGASALPVFPTKYLHVKDSTGAVLVIPAYAA